MVAKYYGRSYGAQELRELAQIGKDGVNLLGISEAAEAIGFRTLAIKTTYDKLLTDAPLPAIVHWDGTPRGYNHFVVIQVLQPARCIILEGAFGCRPCRWSAYLHPRGV